MITSRLPILSYHSIDGSGSVLSISPAQFRQQMQFMREGGWHTLTLNELLSGYENGQWPRRSFAVTFDDGFASFLCHALPILLSCGFSAIVFLVADWVGQTNDWPGQLPWVERRLLLNWSQARAIVDMGMEIGAHSLSHAWLNRLPATESTREIAGSKYVIEDHIGHGVEGFAYPYGQTTPEVEELVCKHYRAGFGTRLGFVTSASRSTAFERIDMYYLRNSRLFNEIESGQTKMYLRFRQAIRDVRYHVSRVDGAMN